MARDIITASQAKKLLDPNAGSVDDDVWAALALGISGLIRDYCSDDFDSGTFTEKFDGDGRQTLWPKHTPISSVASLSDSETGTTYSASDFAIYRNFIRLKNGRTFPLGLQNIEIVYNGGELPEQIQRAAELICIHWFHRRRTVGKTQDGGGQGSQVSVDKSDIPPEAKVILDGKRNTTVFFDRKKF